MDEERLMQEIHSRLGKLGYRSQATSAEHVTDLQEGIEGSNVRSLLDEEVYKEYLGSLSFKFPDALPSANSLIVIAVPQPQVGLVFTFHGRPHEVIIPPTYMYDIDGSVEKILSSTLQTAGYHVAKAALPLKLLAIRSGLGEYGRNNICYVPGMGSFCRLMAFYTDLPCPDEIWREPQMMERCQSCEACIHSCPTGAVNADRFLVRAERCITFHNERINKFPSWIDASWHNCLVGCLYCQMACPENSAFLDWIEHEGTFSEEETNLILHSTPRGRFPTETAEKLKRLDMLEYSNILGRNIRLLINNM